MSDYFKRMNQGREFGPAPAKVTLWLVVDELDGVTRACYVEGQTAYQAKQAAQTLIKDLSANAKFYPNVEFYDGKS